MKNSIKGYFKINFLLISISCFAFEQYTGEKFFIRNLHELLGIKDSVLEQLNQMVSEYVPDQQFDTYLLAKKDRPIFKNFPELAQKLNFVELADLPTPISHWRELGAYLGLEKLYIKHDECTGKLISKDVRIFGGNKIRKLEFLLGEALHHGARTVLTFGCAGSNHAVATAACAHYLGLRSISMLKPQPNSHVLRRNLLLMLAYGSVMHLSPNTEIRNFGTIQSFVDNKYNFGDFPYFIPTGGSCPVGVIGFVNAAFELQDQIRRGIIEEPDRIYVATGSCGTITGLLLGAKAAGLKSKIIGIAVEPEDVAGEFKSKIISLFDQTNIILNQLDPSFPLVNLLPEELEIVMTCAGTEYGLFTPECKEAIHLLKVKEDFTLDGTYTGKAFAGLVQEVKNGKILPTEVVLFWNTFCNFDFDSTLAKYHYQQLPASFHSYFVNDVQELDKVN